MGKVVVTAKLENLAELFDVEKGVLPDDRVRRVEVHDAVVDAGATTLPPPRRVVPPRGLNPPRMRRPPRLGSESLLPVYGPVRLTTQGRDSPVDVGEMGDKSPASPANSS